MYLEIFKAVMTVLGPLLGVGAGSLLTWWATTAAEQRKAAREDALAAQEEIRTHLQERLSLQKEALREYRRVLVKWGSESSNLGLSIVAAAQRTSTEDIEANADAAAVSGLISEAFDSPNFADQAVLTIFAQMEARRSPKIALANPILIGTCSREMRRSIEALQAELGLPKLKVHPKPPVSPEAFTRATKRELITTQGLRAGFPLERIEQLLEKVGLNDAPPAASEQKPEADEADSG